jgi:hypothetical protein
MAQPPQAEAGDGDANVAQLCAAQKLLYADAIPFAPLPQLPLPRDSVYFDLLSSPVP